MNNQSVAAQVAALPNMKMEDLWGLWDEYFPARPPKTTRDSIEARLAYSIQAKAFGDLPPSTKSTLAAIGAAQSKIKLRSANSTVSLVPGTTLIREHHGQEHKVLVRADGMYEHLGRTYKSLSAIAKAITGTQWNGHVFFGLKRSS